MYRFLVILIGTLVLTGCGTLQRERLMDASADLMAKTEQALQRMGLAQAPEDTVTDEHAAELQALFAQPYIDPLTRYLQRHGDDSARQPGLAEVRDERDRRCAAVAARYRSAPLTQAALDRYRAGYSLSCAQDVEAYAGLLKSLRQESAEIAAEAGKAEPAESTQPEAPSEVAAKPVFSQQLNDCYLLTAIRNFSEALKACREPAEAGDLQAQTNMAHIAYAFQDHVSAYRWAREAAPESFEASYLLGKLYAAGHGVEKNSEKAKRWYAKAARQGHAGAQAALGKGSDGTAGKIVN